MQDSPERGAIPSGALTIRDQITRLVAAIQNPDEPCVVRRGQPYLWLPGVVSALDVPYLELPEDDQVAFMEALDVGHWQAQAPLQVVNHFHITTPNPESFQQSRGAISRSIIQGITQARQQL